MPASCQLKQLRRPAAARRPPRYAMMVSIFFKKYSHTKIAPLVTKITYIKMDPRRCIRNGFANGYITHSHVYAACTSRHESSMVPKALKIAIERPASGDGPGQSGS